MKRLFKIILLAIIVNCQSSMVSETHAQTVRDRYNAQIGRVESDGTVRDRYNAQIGKIETNGVVRDRYNAQIGRVESDGTVRDRYNAQIGKVERDGTVRNHHNAQIGKAAGVEPRIAAVIFFMQLLQLN